MPRCSSLESAAGLAANSTALLADSVDMLGDAIVYGFSLYAIGRGLAWQSRAAFLKGSIMAAFGLGILVQVALKLTRGLTPGVETMGIVGLVALSPQPRLPAPAVAPPRGRHQHALGVDLLAQRRDRQRERAGGRRRGVAHAARPGPTSSSACWWPAVFGRSAIGVLADASRA